MGRSVVDASLIFFCLLKVETKEALDSTQCNRTTISNAPLREIKGNWPAESEDNAELNENNEYGSILLSKPKENNQEYKYGAWSANESVCLSRNMVVALVRLSREDVKQVCLFVHYGKWTTVWGALIEIGLGRSPSSERWCYQCEISNRNGKKEKSISAWSLSEIRLPMITPRPAVPVPEEIIVKSSSNLHTV